MTDTKINGRKFYLGNWREQTGKIPFDQVSRRTCEVSRGSQELNGDLLFFIIRYD